jgi:hypothetical protein
MASTTNFNWSTPDDTALVKDGAAAIRTLGSSIDTSFVDLKGGTTGQVLTKASNTDLDFSFTTPAASPITTEGDLIIGDASGDAVRLPIGSAGTVLTSDGDTADWAAPGGALAIAEIASGSLTSGTQLQLSSLTSYDTLLLRVANLQWGSGADSITMTINNSSSSVYDFMVGAMYAQANYVSFEQGTTRAKIDMTAISVKRDSTSNQFQLLLTNCKSTGFTNFELQCVMKDSGNFNAISVGRGIFKSAAAVSTLEFRTENNQTFSAGSYVLWGA